MCLAVFIVTQLLCATADASPYSDVIQAEPTVLFYWPMNEPAGVTTLAAAVGGTAIKLTGAATGASGQLGTAVSFNGVSNYGITASNLNLSAYNKIVVEALLFVDTFDATYRQAWEFGYSSAGIATGFRYSYSGGAGTASFDSSLFLRGNNGNNYATYLGSTAGWHHIVAVYNKGASLNEVELYVDGILQTALTRPVPIGANSDNTNNFGINPIYLMSRSGTSSFGNGKMQHVAVYSDLSDARIVAHAQAAGLATFRGGTLSSSYTTAHTATLLWTSSAYGTAPITEQLQRSPHGENTWVPVSGATASPATDSGVFSTTSYDYRVAYSDAASTTVYSNTVTVAITKQYPAYPANDVRVIVAPYDTAQAGAGNWGPTASGSLEAIVVSHNYRIRQDGTIDRVRLYTASTANITGFSMS